MRLPYMTANVYLGVNYTAIGYTGSQGFIYKEIISGRISAKISDNVEIIITGGAPSTPVSWEVPAGQLGVQSGSFILDNKGRYTLTVTQSIPRSYIYTFRFAATGTILTHKIDFMTDPWVMELINRGETACGPWADVTLTVPGVLYGFGMSVFGNSIDGYHNSTPVDQAALHARLANPGEIITVKRTKVERTLFGGVFGGFGSPGDVTAGFSQNFSSFPAQCGWTMSLTTDPGRPYPLPLGPAPLTAYEGEVLAFKITAPNNAPQNSRAYLVIGQPSTVDMDDISRPYNTAEVNIYDRVGYGEIIINLDKLTEGTEYLQVWVEYPQGVKAGAYGKIDIIDNSKSTRLVIQPVNLPYASIGQLYNIGLTIVGGQSPYTYQVTVGSLPTGILLRPDGSIYGIPTLAGTANFTVTVTDLDGAIGVQNYVLTVDSPLITVSLPPVVAIRNSAYTNTVDVVGGAAPYTVSLVSGSLPIGLTLSGLGKITGTPTVAGSYTFVVKVVDQYGSSNTAEFTISVTTLVITLIPSALTKATVKVNWSQWIATSGATGTLTYEVLNTLTFTSQFPPGVTYNGSSLIQYSSSDGPTLSGIPTVAGKYEFLIRVTDSNGTQDTRTYAIEVDPDEKVQFSPASILSTQPFDLVIVDAVPGSRFRYKLSTYTAYGEWINLNEVNGPGTHRQTFAANLLTSAGTYTYDLEFESIGNVRTASVAVAIPKSIIFTVDKNPCNPGDTITVTVQSTGFNNVDDRLSFSLLTSSAIFVADPSGFLNIDATGMATVSLTVNNFVSGGIIQSIMEVHGGGLSELITLNIIDAPVVPPAPPPPPVPAPPPVPPPPPPEPITIPVPPTPEPPPAPPPEPLPTTTVQISQSGDVTGTVGALFNSRFTALSDGSIMDGIFTLTGNLPPGLTGANFGSTFGGLYRGYEISGIPTLAGVYTFTIDVGTSSGTGSLTVNLAIN